ncbi:hypothetical protein NX794_19415 [Streptomyces sp. LP11]|uniref:Uncharacterized protein n=1 Tax=Streptomyces pyxinicus TaxID=2970331 RepID=A0ABT2B4D8_9ACTN|nr:hypothetical protein [Streptomyces sp. LP11]MCS0603366.1 hypothetical protein [Streptomyces sp. LP11]
MMSHSLQQDVLVITVHEDPGVDGRAGLLTDIGDLVRVRRPAFAVIVLDDDAATEAVVSVVLRAHRLCSDLGVVLSVAACGAPVRRLLEAGADTRGIRLVIHARAETAIATATALTAAA